MSGYVAEERMAIWKKGAKSANSESSPARYESRCRNVLDGCPYSRWALRVLGGQLSCILML